MDDATSKQQSGLINIFETLAVFPNPKCKGPRHRELFSA
jgi:hypothetical protein